MEEKSNLESIRHILMFHENPEKVLADYTRQIGKEQYNIGFNNGIIIGVIATVVLAVLIKYFL